MKNNTPLISIVIPLFGSYAEISPHVCGVVSWIRSLSGPLVESLELILVLHGDNWKQAAALDELKHRGIKILIVDSIFELPAMLMNHGANVAIGQYLLFGRLGIEFNAWQKSIGVLIADLHLRPKAVVIAGNPAKGDIRRNPLQSWLRSDQDELSSGYPSGWLEMLDYAPMSCTLISRDHFLRTGGFSCSPLLQRGFWWEFCIRTSRSESIELSDAMPPDDKWNWYDYPLADDLGLSGDLIARRAVRNRHAVTNLALECDWRDCNSFINDLPLPDRSRLINKLTLWAPNGSAMRSFESSSREDSASIRVDSAPSSPLRIIILGGLNEPAHNQLCFFNYFALLETQSHLTWRTILDTTAHRADLTHADIVIFSRVKSQRGCELMDFCNAQQIPTIYMLDDNWFSIGNDWPEYSSIFSPGADLYEAFLYCAKRANYALTYNALLADDLRAHCPQIKTLPTNIDLAIFPKPLKAIQKRLLIGYVGSLRKEVSAFRALMDCAAERDDFDIFIMSTSIPDGLKGLPQNRLIYRPYVFGYRQYARIICEVQPDILLAPLGKNRTEASKCPNKYLEITAAGAAGVYSDTAPYNQFILDGINGVLAKNNVHSWKSAILRLLEDAALRKDILMRASEEVETNFRTEAVLPNFWKFLQEVAMDRASREPS